MLLVLSENLWCQMMGFSDCDGEHAEKYAWQNAQNCQSLEGFLASFSGKRTEMNMGVGLLSWCNNSQLQVL